jgi:magnesium chelatase subunit D
MCLTATEAMSAPPLDVESLSDPALIGALLALNGQALGGVHVRGPSGPERDAWLAYVQDLLGSQVPMRRCPARIDEERLLGGLDLTASLARGTSVLQRGLLSEADGGVVVFAMAECLTTSLGAQIAAVIDTGQIHIARDGVDASADASFSTILLDEGHSDEERAPDALSERCAFMIETKNLRIMLEKSDLPTRGQIHAARTLLQGAEACPDYVLEALCETAFAFGIASFRPVMAAVTCAQTLAALSGRTGANMADARMASRLILSHRATTFPAPAPEEEAQNDAPENPENNDAGEDSQSPPPSPEDATDSPPAPPAQDIDPTEMLIETVKAALPDGVLAALNAGLGASKKTRERDGRGSGDSFTSPKRGRPVGSRRGSLRSGQRLHLIDTLRAAAPWQKVRATDTNQRVRVQSEDVRIRRFVEKRETTIIFAVDASGSAAWQRLAEAKGAVQLMLAHAYQSRARVALVAFRKENAEIILPPTRSLARARRLLSDMVGGGGTPLAHGLEMALGLALAERAKGRTPRLLVLTDGRGNIARDGAANREQATADSLAIAAQIRAFGLRAVHIDTSPRPRPGADALALKMGGLYAPLPSPRSGDLAMLAGL